MRLVSSLSFRKVIIPWYDSAGGVLWPGATLSLYKTNWNSSTTNPSFIDVHVITMTVLFGVLGFFLLEKTVLWRHCHSTECEARRLLPADGLVAQIVEAVLDVSDVSLARGGAL